MIGFVKDLFGSSSVIDTATKIVDKIAGTDWTPTEKADFILKYQQATKHQSPARRFIATLVTLVWFFILVVMVISYIVGNAISSPQILMIANDMKMLSKDLVTEPFNYVIAFYFAMSIVNNIKK